MTRLGEHAGRRLEPRREVGPRGMAVGVRKHCNRIRLIGLLHSIYVLPDTAVMTLGDGKRFPSERKRRTRLDGLDHPAKVLLDAL